MTDHYWKHILLFVFLLFSILALPRKVLGEDTMSMLRYTGFTVDNKSHLDNLLTQEYDISVLNAFFEGRNTSERIAGISSKSALTFADINANFPIEVIRLGDELSYDYSVFRVTQGGYYYVFWAAPAANDYTVEELTVHFSTYIPANHEHFDLHDLVLGKSTAMDVKKLDPYFELCIFASSGFYSYSYWTNNLVLEICYASTDDGVSYENLHVLSWRIVPRETAPSVYRMITPLDLPGNN